MGRALFVIVLLHLSAATAQAADTLYVTDKLFLGLYPEPATGGASLATLVSGTPLQVLERTKLYVRVRIPDGTEGWVKSAYVVAEKPPRLMLTELEQQRDELRQQLQDVRKQLTSAQQALVRNDQQRSQLQSGREERVARLAQLESDNRALHQRLNATGMRVPLSWLIAAAAACLAFGLWGGYAWIDYRIRRRHGGFRLH